MRLIAFDPGSTHLGWARVLVSGGAGKSVTVDYVDAGHVEGTSDVLAMLIDPSTVDVVGLEKVVGYGYSNRTQGAQAVTAALIATSFMAGTISGIARFRGLRVIEMPAPTWRGMICGKPGAKDAHVKDAVSTLVRGLPKRTNVHVRDALGVACAVAWSETSRGAT